MKARAVGVICPLCGDPVKKLGYWTAQDCWIGYTVNFYHGCQPDSFNQSYILLYDEHKKFVGIIPGDFQFLMSAGNRIYEHDDDEN